jgi:hypothetical protein
MKSTHLWPEILLGNNGYTKISVTLEYPDRSRKILWYQIPSEYHHLIPDSCDAFVVASILTAMSLEHDLVVHGNVSPSLLQNLTEYQVAWSCWRPNQYKQIEILADAEQELSQTSETDRAISAFSGGVDSCFTALRHKTGSCGRVQRNLQAGLMVHGFDIPLEDQEIFDSAVKKSRLILDSIGVDLIPMTTNYRQVFSLNWEDVYVSAIASCFMLLQRGYSTGLVGSGAYTYRNLHFPHGCNPVTDPLLSSNSFRVIHDGAGFNRLEKIQAIAQWKAALEHIRVCWEGEQLDKNCGRCEKCIRTVLGFRLVNPELPECFEQDVTDTQILKLKNLRRVALDELQLILNQAKAEQIKETWVSTLEQCIQNHQPKLALKKPASPLSRLSAKISRKLNRLAVSKGSVS